MTNKLQLAFRILVQTDFVSLLRILFAIAQSPEFGNAY